MTTKEYAESYRELLKQGRTIEELNDANHIGLETHQITMDMFQAAARVLTEAILNR